LRDLHLAVLHQAGLHHAALEAQAILRHPGRDAAVAFARQRVLGTAGAVTGAPTWITKVGHHLGLEQVLRVGHFGAHAEAVGGRVGHVADVADRLEALVGVGRDTHRDALALR
jgi:hypothetical protein